MSKTPAAIAFVSQKLISTPLTSPTKFYGSEDFLNMIKEQSKTSVQIRIDHDNYGSPNRAHSIWVGSEFPPDPIMKPKTKGFAENVASLKKYVDYNHILWIDLHDYNNFTVEMKKITIEYCNLNKIALIVIQDVFPNSADNIELQLYHTYQVEHEEKNMAGAADALRVMVLRRFYGLYLDVDITVKKAFDYDYFSNKSLQFVVEHPSSTKLATNNCIISVPRNNTEIELIALEIIRRHKLPLAEVLTSKVRIWTDFDNDHGFYTKNKNYLHIPYHFIRFARTVIATGPGVYSTKYFFNGMDELTGDFFTINKSSSETTANVPVLKVQRQEHEVNLECFIVENVNSWVGNVGSFRYHKHDIPEYRFPAKNLDEAESKIEKFLLYYHYLEDRTLRFDFFRADIIETFLQNQINLESVIFNRLVKSSEVFAQVEYIYFNLFETFEQNWKVILDRRVFPNLNHSLYVCELLSLSKKNNLDLKTLGVLDSDVIDIIQKKSFKNIYQNDWGNFRTNKNIYDLVSGKAEIAIFARLIHKYSNQYLAGTSADRQYFVNLLKSTTLYCLSVACNETEYHWQSICSLPAKVTDKIINESDRELLQLLADNQIGLTVADQASYLKLVDLILRGKDRKGPEFFVHSDSFSIALERSDFDYIDYLAKTHKCFDIFNLDILATLINNQNILPGTRAIFKNYFLNNPYLINQSIDQKNIKLFNILGENKVALVLNHEQIESYEEVYELCKDNRDLQMYFEFEIIKDQTMFTCAICNHHVFIISLFAKHNVKITKTYFGTLLDMVSNRKPQIDYATTKYLMNTARHNNPLLPLVDSNKNEFEDKVIAIVNKSIHCFAALAMLGSFFAYIVSIKMKALMLNYSEIDNQMSPAPPCSFFSNSQAVMDATDYIEKIKSLQLVYVAVLENIRDIVVKKTEFIDDYTIVLRSIDYTNNPPKNQAVLDFNVSLDNKNSGETECRQKGNNYIREISVALKLAQSQAVIVSTSSDESAAEVRP